MHKHDVLKQMRGRMRDTMAELTGEFLPFTGYQKWMNPRDPYACLASAQGAFVGAFDPIPRLRCQKEKRA